MRRRNVVAIRGGQVTFVHGVTHLKLSYLYLYQNRADMSVYVRGESELGEQQPKEDDGQSLIQRANNSFELASGN
jgi:hypothetical protein